MNITEVRLILPEPSRSSGKSNVLAYGSVTFDRVFVVRDVKIVESRGRVIVSMPSHRLTDHCPGCQSRNPVTARYCMTCGRILRDDRAKVGEDGRKILFADSCHPVTPEFRRELESAVLEAYRLKVYEMAVA